MTVDPEDLAELQALLAMEDEQAGDEDPPDTADEAKATAKLGALGQAQRQISETESLFDAFELELVRRIEMVREKKATRLEPLLKEVARLESWLHGWHLANVSTDKRGRPVGLTKHLPTGTMKLGAKGTDVEVVEPEVFLVWAEEHAASLVVQPERPPQPPPRPDGRALRSYALEEIGLLPTEPEPGAVLTPVPGVRVTIKARKFTVAPDV